MPLTYCSKQVKEVKETCRELARQMHAGRRTAPKDHGLCMCYWLEHRVQHITLGRYIWTTSKQMSVRQISGSAIQMQDIKSMGAQPLFSLKIVDITARSITRCCLHVLSASLAIDAAFSSCYMPLSLHNTDTSQSLQKRP